MAVYIPGSVSDLESIDSIKKVQEYLIKQERKLDYMFNNLDPEENYSELARLTMVTDGQRQATIEATLQGIQLNYVSKDGIVSAINLSEEMIQIEASKIKLEGVVTVNGNFKVGLDGSIEARNGKFSGSISGSDIALGGLGGGDGYIVVYNSSGTEIGRWSKDGINVGAGSIQGADITLGGVNNIDGTLTIRDANGATIGSWTKDGITATGGTFSGTITSSHIYGTYIGTTEDNFFVLEDDGDVEIGLGDGFWYHSKLLESNTLGSWGNPASGDDSVAAINADTGAAGFKTLYLQGLGVDVATAIQNIQYSYHDNDDDDDDDGDYEGDGTSGDGEYYGGLEYLDEGLVGPG